MRSLDSEEFGDSSKVPCSTGARGIMEAGGESNQGRGILEKISDRRCGGNRILIAKILSTVALNLHALAAQSVPRSIKNGKTGQET